MAEENGKCCGRPMVQVTRRMAQCEECGNTISITPQE